MSTKKLTAQQFDALSIRFRALSEVSRLKIISALQSSAKSVNELVEETGLSQPNVSRHLQILSQAGLIERKRFGTTIICQIVDKSLFEICALVCKQVS